MEIWFLDLLGLGFGGTDLLAGEGNEKFVGKKGKVVVVLTVLLEDYANLLPLCLVIYIEWKGTWNVSVEFLESPFHSLVLLVHFLCNLVHTNFQVFLNFPAQLSRVSSHFRKKLFFFQKFQFSL